MIFNQKSSFWQKLGKKNFPEKCDFFFMFGVDLGQKSAKKLFGNDLLLKIFILAKIGKKKFFPEKCDCFLCLGLIWGKNL